MRKIACTLGMVVLGGAFTSCGGPPMLLTGTISYSWRCEFEAGPTPETTHPECPGDVKFYSGTAGTGPAPGLIVGCSVNPTASGMTNLRFRIAAGGTSLQNSEGITLCGQVAGAGQEMTNTTVDLYVRGSYATNQPAPGVCQVRINELSTNGFSGQMRCRDARDNQVPYRKLLVSGVSSGPNATQDPEWADFSFSNCTTVTQPPCR